PRREPMERKSGGDVKGGRTNNELLKAPPTITLVRGLSHNAPVDSCTGVDFAGTSSSGRVGRAHPNPHAKEGDGVRGHRVSPPPLHGGVAGLLSGDTEDTAIR
ncbi:MAG: hypothetical protein HYY68_09265, partial [Thaumarchaeota archaeon]|nr:hypothetical protein [Nitrososphaerota archaeon]